MDNEKMGQLIAELRKSHQMTQKDLAEKLQISDKAVSKWERGLSCPDIALLSPLADTLDVTTGELLNGERNSSANADTEVGVEAVIDNALHYADNAAQCSAKSLRRILALAFSAALIIGALTCAICDLAISGAFTWSLYPLTAIVFAWFVFLPVILLRKRGALGSLIALSVLAIPYLWVLSLLVGGSLPVWTISIRMALIALPFFWVVFGVFKLLRTRKLIASAVSLLLIIPLYFLINFALSKIINEPLIDIWDVLSLSIIVVAALILFVLGFTMRKRVSRL